MLSIASRAVQTWGGAAGIGIDAAHARAARWLMAERHQLVLWAPVLLGAGIAAYFALPRAAQWQAGICLGAALAAAGLALRGLPGRCLFWAGLLFAAGLSLAWLRAERVAAPRLERPLFAHEFTADVLAVEDRSARGQYRVLLAPRDPALPRVRVALREAPPAGVDTGATIRLRATLRPPPGPTVPGGYDFARRSWFEGIGATGYALGPIRLVAAARDHDVMTWLARLRHDLTQRLRQEVGGPAGGIAAALVTGDRGGIPEQVTQDMRDSGLAHLLSISGMHIAVVVGGTMWLVRRLLLLSPWLALRWPLKTIAAAVAACAGIAYTLLAGAEVPTVRSCIATLVVLVGLSLGRQAISLRTVAFAAFLILLLRPEALIGPSFQLSFAAVVAIVALYRSRLGRELLTSSGDVPLPVRVGRSLLALVATGLLVEAALAPIALAHFGRAGFYGVMANVVAIPFSSFVVMPAAAAALLLDPLGLAAPAHAVLGWSLDLLIQLAATVAGWPGAVSRLPSMPMPAFAGFILGGLWLFVWQGRRRWLGLVPIAAATVAAWFARPADLIVSPDGRHVGLVREGRLAMLRPRAGGFVADMWSDATASMSIAALAQASGARCSRDSCVASVERGGRTWRLLATRSTELLDWRALTAACRNVDIVVSDRRLPDGCRPKWLRLDRAALARTGAVAIRFDPLSVVTVADGHGDHPWTTAAADQWYRRSSPTSLP